MLKQITPASGGLKADRASSSTRISSVGVAHLYLATADACQPLRNTWKPNDRPLNGKQEPSSSGPLVTMPSSDDAVKTCAVAKRAYILGVIRESHIQGPISGNSLMCVIPYRERPQMYRDTMGDVAGSRIGWVVRNPQPSKSAQVMGLAPQAERDKWLETTHAALLAGARARYSPAGKPGYLTEASE